MDLGFIIRQCKKAHYCGWSDEELQICIEKAKLQSHDDLFQLYNSKWLYADDPFKRELFFLSSGRMFGRSLTLTTATES